MSRVPAAALGLSVALGAALAVNFFLTERSRPRPVEPPVAALIPPPAPPAVPPPAAPLVPVSPAALDHSGEGVLVPVREAPPESAPAARVRVTIRTGEAASWHTFSVVAPIRRVLGGTRAPVSGPIELGRGVPAGSEVIFALTVLDDHKTYYNGPASRNPDGVVHALAKDLGFHRVELDFEDGEGGGDRDYNDAVLIVEGVSLGRDGTLRASAR